MIIWIIAALLIGALQARWLWRDAERPCWYGMFGRYLMIVALLLPAARFGMLLITGLAWFAGFTGCALLLLRSSRR